MRASPARSRARRTTPADGGVEHDDAVDPHGVDMAGACSPRRSTFRGATTTLLVASVTAALARSLSLRHQWLLDADTTWLG